MGWMNLDMFGYELGEGDYCPNCDHSGNDLADVRQLSPLEEVFYCTNCGWVYPKVMLTDYGYQFQNYMLSGSEYDEGLRQMYDGTWK